MRSLPVSGAQKDVLMWAGIGVLGLALVYVVIKKVIPSLTKAAGDAGKGVADSVANAPAVLAQSAANGLDNLVHEIATPFSDWWKGLDSAVPAPVNAGSLVNSSYYAPSTGTTNAAGGQNFGVIDGATW